MAGNTFGTIFKLTSFGESHGSAIGGVIDGCPAGLHIDDTFIQQELARRKPGQSHVTTQRKEEDRVVFLSGIFKNKSTGAPIGFIIHNNDTRTSDYKHLKNTYRPSHADYTYDIKYGDRDYRGGGRSSARETAVRVVAGAIAKLLLKHYDTTVTAFVSQVGSVKLDLNLAQPSVIASIRNKFKHIETNAVRCPDAETARAMIKEIEAARLTGDSVGGRITCIANRVPAGLGEPVFNKLHAELGKAMLGINAVKGFEYGSGFDAAAMHGSTHNDSFIPTKSGRKISTKTNYSGGIQGGISNGLPVYFNVAFKPVASILQEQHTVDKKGKAVSLQGKGRHDPCVVPRAVPIVEAMTALVLADYLLLNKTSRM